MGVRKGDEGKGQEDLRLKILKSHIEAFIFFFLLPSLFQLGAYHITSVCCQ